MKKNIQKGVSLTEFIIIAPLLLFIGLIGIQYGLIYVARLNVTYAAYEAARAGAIYNADPARIQNAFIKGLVPYFATPGIYLPGNNHVATPISKNPNLAQVALQGTALKEIIKKTESAFMHIHIINPSKASFDDWNDDLLAKAYRIKTGQNVRIISNDNLDTKATTIKNKSKQNIQDANVLKLRFVYGYEPRIPLMKNIFSSLTSFFTSNRDAANLRMLAAGRIPIVVDISAQMLSPAIEAGLPTNTVNRNGYLVGEDLINRLQENQAMQWQVGQKKNDLLDGIQDSAEQSAISQFEKDATDLNAIDDIGSALLGGLAANNSPTGKAGSSTNSIIGDTNNLISCSSGKTITNFY
ncbi:TadE family protein [Acinetobacter sp. AG3]|uniref:TadE/TadG family type IV pilus assembly protein n=1 Tax=Acinetobacter sp. AG3 TaxID=2912245 RepID=UPI001EF0D4EC|nr:TadE family protein [Acinetobacter sp. AG3]MCG7220155.1 pilus assembly protein [Acinetobacter sp. AG3]